MTTAGASTLGGVLTSPEEARVERRPRAELDAWAATLAHTLTQRIPPQPPPGPPGSTAAWRPSVGALTAGADSTSNAATTPNQHAAPGAGGATQETPNADRLHISTHVADLGEIAVMVDRSHAGVRVVIGVEDARAASMIDPERARLQGALLAAGVGVDSIRVVQLERRGTLLASSKASVSRTPNQRPELVDQDDPKKRSRGRKVNLVG